MTSTTSKNWKDWPTPPILEETVYSKNPAGILRALQKMSRRKQVGFHLAELEGARQSWDLAATAALGTPSLVTACLEQRDKFKFWIDELKNGMVERRDSGIMIIEHHDWPHKALFDMAIVALEEAQISEILTPEMMGLGAI